MIGLLILAAIVPLPPLPSANIIVLPPNTNTYGLPLTWDAPTNGLVTGYRLYWQWPPAQQVFSTNILSTNITQVIRLPVTNSPPLIWATAIGDNGIESEWSNVFTKTNYTTFAAERSTNVAGPWSKIPESVYTEVRTNAADFYRVHATNFDNYATVP